MSESETAAAPDSSSPSDSGSQAGIAPANEGRTLLHGGDKIHRLDGSEDNGESQKLAKLSEKEDVGEYVREREEQIDDEAEEEGTLPPQKAKSRSQRYKEKIARTTEALANKERELAELRDSGVGLGPEHVEQIRAAGAFEARANNARQQIPDFDAVVQSAAHLPINDHMASLIRKSEAGPRIAYELASAPEILAKLNELPQQEAARVIGRLEMLIESERGNRSAIPARVTKAPAPLKPLKGGSSPSKTPEELADNMTDYMKDFRKRQGERR